MLNKIKKYLQKRFNYRAYLDIEMQAADYVGKVVPTIFEVWKLTGTMHHGETAWAEFLRRPAFLGYLFAWCDLMAISSNAEPGGNGSMSGFLRALQAVAPNWKAEETLYLTCRLSEENNVEFRSGTLAGEKDYNQFAGGSKLPPVYLPILIQYYFP